MRPSPPGLVTGSLRVLVLSLRTQLFNRRMLLPLVLLSVGPFLALNDPTTAHTTSELTTGGVFHLKFAGIYLGPITLLVTLLLSTAAIGDELEANTLVNLYVRPLARSSVYFGKYLWAGIVAWSGIALSVGLTYSIIESQVGIADLDYLLQFLAVQLLAVGTYSALFLAVSLIVPFPIVVGLIYSFGIEVAVASMPGYLARASLQFHLGSLIDALVLKGRVIKPLIEEGPVGGETAFWVLIGTTLVGVVVGLVVLAIREFTGRLGKSS